MKRRCSTVICFLSAQKHTELLHGICDWQASLDTWLPLLTSCFQSDSNHLRYSIGLSWCCSAVLVSNIQCFSAANLEEACKKILFYFSCMDLNTSDTKGKRYQCNKKSLKPKCAGKWTHHSWYDFAALASFCSLFIDLGKWVHKVGVFPEHQRHSSGAPPLRGQLWLTWGCS